MYAPNYDQPEFFVEMFAHVNTIQDYNAIVMGGDFNLVMDPGFDRLNSLYNHDKSIQILKESNLRCGLCDIWRLRYPDKHMYSWFRRSGNNSNKKIQASRIDMLFVSECIADRVEECDIQPGVLTDHSIVTVTLSLDTFKRGPGLWKLNNQLLFDDKYVECIRDVLLNTITNCPLLNPADLWCSIKSNCAIASKQYAKQLAARKKTELDNLHKMRNLLQEDVI